MATLLQDIGTAVGAAIKTEKNRITAVEATKAPLASPALTGTPTAPTATLGTNSTQLATTAFATSTAGHYRLTLNQNCEITDGVMRGWFKNGSFPITLSLYTEIVSGQLVSSYTAEHKEILSAMGGAYLYMDRYYFGSNIRIAKMTWSNSLITEAQGYGHLVYQFINRASTTTTASYAKLISGGVRGNWLEGITNTWGLCGSHSKSGWYTHNHPFTTTATGEVLFAMPATVSGIVPLDRNSPVWRIYPYLENNFNL